MSSNPASERQLNVSATALWRIRVNSVLPDLGAAERRVAEYVLAKAEAVVGQTITEVAQHSKSSEATVVRFCRRIGYPGYQAVKIAIAQEVVPVWQNLEDDVTPDDKISEIKQKVFTRHIKALQETYSLVMDESLSSAVRAIQNARRLDLYGVGGSGAVARDAAHKFMKIGVRVTAFTDSNLQVMSAAHLRKGDVALAVSYSGSVRDVVEALQVARRSQATTIAITHLGSSPIVEASDICLFTTAMDIGHRSDAGASRLGQLAILDTLFAAVAISHGDAVAQAFQRMMEELAIKGY